MSEPFIRTQKGFGWKRQLPDQRDRLFVAPPIEDLPPQGSLDPHLMPPVFNQQQLGSCTGASSSRAVMYLEAKEGQPRLEQSALFAYYNARVIEGTVNSDSGASIRDVVQGIVSLGLCAEKLYPYNIARFAAKPSARAYKDAKYSVLNSYELIASNYVTAAKSAIHNKWPVEFGFSVYQSFESDVVTQTGIVPMPKENEQVIGGHAVWAWQYDNAKGFLCRNSWGPDWGLHGDFWLPYDYFGRDDLAGDRWVLKAVS